MWLVGIGIVALGARLTYAGLVENFARGDAEFYRGAASALAAGNGYADPLTVARGDPQPTAQHPPLFAMYLAVWTRIGVHSIDGHEFAACLLGTVAVVLIWAVGRRVENACVGLIAAGLAAVYPPLFMLDASINSESLYVPLIVLILLLAYRLVDEPGATNAAALGGAIGIATLTRSDAILLVLLLVLPLVWRMPRRSAQMFAVATGTMVLVIAPWIVRNWLAFDKVPLLSTNGGYTARATNCDDTYYRPSAIGFVSHSCAIQSSCYLRFPVGARARVGPTEAPRDECLQREARRYVTTHLQRAPLVALARVERVWELYRPRSSINYGALLWGRPKTMATIALITYGLIATLAIAGAYLLRTSHRTRLPLFALVAQATLVAVLAFGFTRYRVAAEPALLVLAAVTIEWVLRGRRHVALHPAHGHPDA